MAPEPFNKKCSHRPTHGTPAAAPRAPACAATSETRVETAAAQIRDPAHTKCWEGPGLGCRDLTFCVDLRQIRSGAALQPAAVLLDHGLVDARTADHIGRARAKERPTESKALELQPRTRLGF